MLLVFKINKYFNIFMYDSLFKCTYNLLTISDPEESDLLYQFQFLQAFKMEQAWDDSILSKKIQYIEDLLLSNEKGRQILYQLNNITLPLLNNSNNIMYLFSYDIFYLFHDCICDLINSNNIYQNHYDKLIQTILLDINT